MKKLFMAASALLATTVVFAQQLEITTEKDGTKILKGFIPMNDIRTDPSFGWFAENQKGYTPDAGTVQSFKNYKDSVYIFAFGGTWCGDTKHILPQVSATMDAAGFPQDHFTLMGVDRNKKTIQHLSESFGITNVPTFIVLSNGKEIGRVVEYGKMGMPEREIAQILDAAFKK